MNIPSTNPMPSDGHHTPQRHLDRPLSRAIEAGALKAVRRLLQEGAHLKNQPSGHPPGAPEWDTSLASALKVTPLNADLVLCLLEAGANPNGRTADPAFPAPLLMLFTQLDHPIDSATRLARTRILTELLARGADIEASTPKGNRIIHHVCRFGTPEDLKILLTHSPTLTGADSSDQTALGTAVLAEPETQAENFVRLLLEAGCPMDNVALFRTMRHNRMGVLTLLLRAGADLDQTWEKHPKKPNLRSFLNEPMYARFVATRLEHTTPDPSSGARRFRL